MRRSRDLRIGAALMPPIALTLALGLAACGAGSKHAAGDEASADVNGRASASCGTTAMNALSRVALRVYGEGIHGERVGSAQHLIEGSSALREAVEAGDPRAVQAAGRALLATGHLTDLRVVRAGKVLVELGGPAVAPIQGTLSDSKRRPLAEYVTSVWAAGGLVAETNGIAQGLTVIRAARSPSDTRSIAGSFPIPVGRLPASGTLSRKGVAYQFTSVPVKSYPDGAPARLYLVRKLSSLAPLCGASEQDTTFNTISRVAHLIYDGEAGRRTGPQIGRVQRNHALLEAVARRDPQATRVAVERLLHQHIVRLRVTSSNGRLLADVGGPYVLAPVAAPLRIGGRTIGGLLLSIQDDEGYKRLANRLAGLDVLMYMGGRLVKSTVGFSPGPVPEGGPVTLHGRSYRAYTFKATAFPSGPLRITVLIPLPYS